MSKSNGLIDLAGKVFHDFTVIEYIPDKKKWKCQCACGEFRDIRSIKLRNGSRKSCGHRKGTVIPPKVQPPVNMTNSNGLHDTEEAKLVGRAIVGNWAETTRWPTGHFESNLREQVGDAGDRTLVEDTTLTVFDLLHSENPRARGIAVKAAISMEAQNASDDHIKLSKTLPDLHHHTLVEDRQEKMAGIMDRFRLKSRVVEEGQ